MKELSGQVALVTGAAKRIGREIALSLARSGADVAITFNSSSQRAKETVSELEALGVKAAAIRCDVRRESDIRNALQKVVERFGRLDLLVNNAGMYETIDFLKITSRQWDNIFAVNLRGPFLASQAAAAELKRRRGRIINIGSLGGLHPWPTHAHYCASKAALHMLSMTMAKALGPEISVNCVAPGVVAQEESDKASLKAFAAKTPMRQNAKPSDIAEAVLFFATGPHFITGQIMAVDGGLGLK
jgi:3-oxoacyl-[acyl-carrier protein] reductase/pteridine reductase